MNSYMNSNKVLTIIIPTYNMENYLRKCLDSLLVSQENMDSLEVLVVNDGSKDSSSDIAHEFELKYKGLFRVIDKENGNYGSCVNRGLKEATGKYVKVIDADDYSDPVLLDKYISFLRELDVDLIISDFNVVSSSGKIIQTNIYTHLIDPEQGIVLYRELINHKANIALQMHAITYRLSLLREMSYRQTEGISYTDTEWATKPMTRVKSVCYFHYPIYNYLIGREGQTMSSYSEVSNPKQLFEVIKNISSFYQEQDYDLDYDLYVAAKLKKAISIIYEAGLKYHSMSLEELRDYDEQLKYYPKAYKLTDTLKLIHDHINYVRYWRSGNLIEQLVFIKLPPLLRKIIKR